MHRSILYVALSLVAGSAHAYSTGQTPACYEPADALPDPEACDAPPSLGPAGEARAPYGCGEARVFFVDFPVWGTPPSPEFPARLQDEFGAWVADIGPELCRDEACDPGCYGAFDDGLEVRVKPVFEERVTPHPSRDSGHLRHWRVSLVAGDGEALVIDPGWHCAAVEALRVAASTAGQTDGVPPATLAGLKIGREACGPLPMSGLSSPGLEAPICSEIGPAAYSQGDGEADVDVVVIDTGVSPAHAVALDVIDVQTHLYSPSLPAPPGIHPHGAAVAEMVRFAAEPHVARLASHQAMNADGFAVVADIARSLDAALHERDGATVLNLSLGWMPELARQRQLEGPGCATVEDDVGEAMRYALTVAAEVDTPDRPVAVVAAAGNRPLSGERPFAYRVDPAAPFDALTPGWWTGPEPREPLLMPAEYAHTGGLTIVPVGAVDDLDRQSTLSIMPPSAEPHLVAPGQHLRLSTLADATDASILTGTSLAAGYVSGLIARALDGLADRRAVDPGLPRIDGAGAAALLYLAGQPVGRDAHDGLPIHRAHPNRLDAAIECEMLADALDCIDAHPGDRRGQLIDCLPLLAECDLPDEPPCGRQGVALFTPCSQETGLTETATSPARTTWSDAQSGLRLTFGGDPALAPDRIDAVLAGPVGPSPFGPGCSDCWSAFSSSQQETLVYMRMSTRYPSGTLFSDPHLLVYDAQGTKAVVALDIGGSKLSPGDHFLTQADSVPSIVVDKALLVLTVEQYGKAPVQNTSALEVYAY